MAFRPISSASEKEMSIHSLKSAQAVKLSPLRCMASCVVGGVTESQLVKSVSHSLFRADSVPYRDCSQRRIGIAEAAPKPAAKAGFQLASAVDTVLALGYAPADTATSSETGVLKELDSNPLADADTRHTAIYDITSHTVYLPNGRRLEAHSGLGRHMDDPRSAAIRMNGVTPPNVYDLRMRKSLFHGVRALRLIPKDQSKMHGRSGILAHTYMLGPNGQSNGCVSFNNYPAFLEAYERGEITRLVVVEHLDDVPRRRPRRIGSPISSRIFSVDLEGAFTPLFG